MRKSIADSLTAQVLTDAYDQYYDDIVRHCDRTLQNTGEAEDLAQDTFLRVWQYLQHGRSVENMKTFLYSVANNLMIDRFRKNGKGTMSLDLLQEQGFDVSYDANDALQRRMHVDRLLEALQQKQDYRLIILRYMKGLPPSEIAGIMGMRANTVAVRLHRIVKRLSQKFLPTLCI